MSDLFESYKKGIDRLLETMGKDHPDYNKVLTQRHRLIENIEEAELHDDNPTSKADRNKILNNLDKIALRAIGQPFHELYESNQKPSTNKLAFNAPPGNVLRPEQVTPAPSKVDRLQTSDLFDSYNNGTLHLLEIMGKAHPDYLEALTLQTRLQENIERARQFGDTEARKANRAEIVEQLNHLTRQMTGKSFPKFCGLELDVNESESHIDPNLLTRILEAQRIRLSEMEEAFDKPGPRKFTEDSLSFLEADLLDMIIGIRKTPVKSIELCIRTTDCVLKNLREACDCLSISLDILAKKRRTQQYYRSLRRCQVHLVNALRCW
jgi:hypothetical protein